MKRSHFAVLASLALGGLAIQSGAASAVPMIDTGPATVAHSEATSGLQLAYWHGDYGWHRHWHPGWHRRFGWHRPFWHHRHGGWHHRYWR